MDNAISFTWKRRDEGARAEGDPKQCYLSSWIVHCDGEGKKMRCKWEKTSYGRHGGGDCGCDVSGGAGRFWSPCVWKSLCTCTNVLSTPSNMCSCGDMCDVTFFGQWDCDFQTCFVENFPHSHSREVKVTIMALHYIPLQLQWSSSLSVLRMWKW